MAGGPNDRLSKLALPTLDDTPHSEHRRSRAQHRRKDANVASGADGREYDEEKKGDFDRLEEEETSTVQLSGQTRCSSIGTPEQSDELDEDQR